MFTSWIFYALGAMAVFVLRRKKPDAPRPFRVPGYPITPILFVVSAAMIVIERDHLAAGPCRGGIRPGTVGSAGLPAVVQTQIDRAG